MKITLLVIGKTEPEYLRNGIDLYNRRLSHYCNFNLDIVPDIKNAGNMLKQELMNREAEALLKRVESRDLLVLLDERGKNLSSRKLAEYLQKHSVNSPEKIVFLIGGAFGVDESIRKRANMILSLSEMTFSHQMIRLFMTEQLYRAFTIIRNENYHND